jgi:hypothetical protein
MKFKFFRIFFIFLVQMVKMVIFKFQRLDDVETGTNHSVPHCYRPLLQHTAGATVGIDQMIQLRPAPMGTVSPSPGGR